MLYMPSLWMRFGLSFCLRLQTLHVQQHDSRNASSEQRRQAGRLWLSSTRIEVYPAHSRSPQQHHGRLQAFGVAWTRVIDPDLRDELDRPEDGSECSEHI